MYITITIDIERNCFDLSIDERGSASTAYSILKERGLVSGGKSPALYKSKLLGEWVEADKPLLDQYIVSGDFLTAQT